MDTFDIESLWDYDDPAGTEDRFRALLPAAEDGGDPEYHLQLLTQIARTFSLRRMFAEAHALLNTVETRLSGSTPVARVRWLLELGRTYNSAGDKPRAYPLFLEAFELAQAAGADFHTIDAAHMAAIAAVGPDSLGWNLQAIALAEQSADERARGWLGSLLNNTGWTYHDMGAYEIALDLFQRALAFRRTRGEAATIRIAQWCVGRCLRSLGRINEAMSVQQEILAASGGEDDGYTQEEMGELLLLAGQPDDAAAHFQAAYTILSQDAWLMENEPDRMARLKALAGQRGPEFDSGP